MNTQPLIPATTNLPEITLKVVLLSILLSLVLAVSNAYLALKIGLLTSASIPAAVISMGILRFFKEANVLENNLVQTAASAGEAIAGGIVYTIPALVIIHYWTSFGYWQNFLIALIGGVLGVMFSIPLRKVLMTNDKLAFPEGRAIAEVLKISNHRLLGVKDIIYGAIFGSLLEFCQVGIKMVADSWQLWFQVKRILFGFGMGFSPVMIGAGYLIGFRLAASLLIGALIGWLGLVPLFSLLYPDLLPASGTPTQMVQALWGSKIRYVGIGAMLVAGLITLASLLKPLIASMALSLKALRVDRRIQHRLRTDFDMPMPYVMLISVVFMIALFFLYQHIFPVAALQLGPEWSYWFTYLALFYTVIIGFVFCAITAYFSGMVGVSTSPGSSIVIAGLLITALLIFVLLHQQGHVQLTPTQIKASEAIAIICTAIITGMAAIANDNMQDLKVGYLLGSTPWKQQVMLLLGVVCAASIIGPIIQKLYSVYGIAGVMPRPGMDATLSLPAPPAAVMAVLSEAVFQQHIPWNMLFIGGAITLAVSLINPYLSQCTSVLGIAMGIYLPLTTSIPLFIGGLIALTIKRRRPAANTQRDTMLACGLIAGPALLDVLLAIPFSLLGSPDALNIAPSFWAPIAILLSLFFTLCLYRWFRYLV